MLKFFLSAFILLSTLSVYSQTIFKKAYYVDLENDTIHGLIKNYDWKYNPDYFIFKKNINSEEVRLIPENVLLFEVINTSKYISRKVQIDVSDSRISRLSKEKPANYENKHLFLKTLVEGKASLFRFSNSQYDRYFFETAENKLEQLVYKEYVNDDNKILKNNRFRQQLLLKMNCEQIHENLLRNIKYKQKPLVKYVLAYNSCFEAPTTNYLIEDNYKSFFFTLRPGLQLSSLHIKSGSNSTNSINFEDKFGLQIGLEVEYVMPFNNRKWSLLLEPTYQSYSSIKRRPESFLNDRFAQVDYQSIVLSLGVRYHLFLNEKRRIFLNAGLSQDFPFNSSLKGNMVTNAEITNAYNLFLGSGFKLNNKLSVEMRYQFRRNLFSNYGNRSAEYQSYALVFGYCFW